MTTPARKAEAERVDLVYYWALTELGQIAFYEHLDLFDQVPPNRKSLTSAGSSWLSRAIDLVMGRRSLARDLALAYYRLSRALHTGTTVKVPSDKAGTLSLETLRDDFIEQVDRIDTLGKQKIPAAHDGKPLPPPPSDSSGNLPDPLPAEEPQYTDLMYEDDDSILTDEIADLEKLIAQQERDAEQEVATVLDQLGIENLNSKLDKIKQQEAADEAAQKAHAEAARRQAAAAERITMNAARGLVYSLADSDPRVVAWVRYSQTGTPCGWCAMLLSRGMVYKSRTSAEQASTAKRDQDLYHDNCHCVAVPIFFPSQYQGALFALNREYADLWKKHIAGKYGGEEALSQWRRLIRNKYDTQTQAAA